MEHLACFVPGMLALGTLQMSNRTLASAHLEIAHELASTCYQMYARQRTGLSPDEIEIIDKPLNDNTAKEENNEGPIFKMKNPKYHLR